MNYRKIGGIHWLSIGSLRISWCIKRKPRSIFTNTNTVPTDIYLEAVAVALATRKRETEWTIEQVEDTL